MDNLEECPDNRDLILIESLVVSPENKHMIKASSYCVPIIESRD